ncbi:MAG: archease [Phycisphaerae bacterium]
MTRKCETFEHTADVGLAAEADSAEELLEALGEGLARFICPKKPEGNDLREVEVEAEDTESLCVDFLWEIMSIMNFESFVVAGVKVTAFSEVSVRAELTGETFDPDRHEYDAEVKAVTHHELTFEQQGGKWVARVILDL